MTKTGRTGLPHVNGTVLTLPARMVGRSGSEWYSSALAGMRRHRGRRVPLVSAIETPITNHVEELDEANADDHRARDRSVKLLESGWSSVGWSLQRSFHGGSTQVSEVSANCWDQRP